jgi:hypothetical protein
MVFFLRGNIPKHEREVLLTEANHAIASLPLEYPGTRVLIRVVRTPTLQCLDQFANGDMWLDVDRQVDMRRGAADAVKIHPLGLPTAIGDEAMDYRFQFGGQHRMVILDMPIEMEVDLVIHMTGHG